MAKQVRMGRRLAVLYKTITGESYDFSANTWKAYSRVTHARRVFREFIASKADRLHPDHRKFMLTYYITENDVSGTDVMRSSEIRKAFAAVLTPEEIEELKGTLYG